MWTALESNLDLCSHKPVTYTVFKDVLFIANDPYHLNNCQKEWDRVSAHHLSFVAAKQWSPSYLYL